MKSTVRKNSKEFKEVIKSTGWTMYNLANCFTGEEVNCTMEEEVETMSCATLRKGENGYTLRIHSNLWFTKSL